MSSATFQCPACAQPLTLPSTFSGPQVQCPHCQTAIQVPNTAQAGVPQTIANPASLAVPPVVIPENIERSIGKMALDTATDTGEMTPTRQLFMKLTEQVQKIFVGQDELVLGTLVSLFSAGHVLIESVPGLGKTLFVRTLGHALGCDFGRIQFTADLMPSDVTGAPVFNMKSRSLNSTPDLYLPSFYWQMKSIVHRPKHMRHYWKSCRNIG